MKKIIAITLVFFIGYSCAKDDTEMFDKSSTERANENAKEFKSQLGSSNWVIELFPRDDQFWGGFSVHSEYDMVNNKVILTRENGNSDGPTNFDILTRSGSLLSFNEYSDGIHFYAKPSSSYPKGQYDTTDYEFLYLRTEKNEMYTKGVKTRNQIRFFATDLSATDYNQAVEEADDAFTNKLKILYLSKPTQARYKVLVSTSSRRYVGLENVETGKVEELPYVYRPNGIRFYKPYNIAGFEVEYLEFNQNKTELTSEDGNVVFSLGESIINFSGKEIVFQTGKVSPSFLTLYNNINTSSGNILQDKLAFGSIFFGYINVVSGQTSSGGYGYERKETYEAPNIVYFKFTELNPFFATTNSFGFLLLNEISSRSGYLIDDSDPVNYKLTSVDDPAYWFLLEK